jgi:hypothetical protein
MAWTGGIPVMEAMPSRVQMSSSRWHRGTALPAEPFERSPRLLCIMPCNLVTLEDDIGGTSAPLTMRSALILPPVLG